MADEKIAWPESTPTAVSDYQAQNTLLSKVIIGFMETSLTNYNNTSLPAIAAGSIIEVAGSLFQFAAEAAVDGSAAAGMNYIYMLPSGDDLTPTWSTVAPTWNAALQGWYGTGAAATYRYVASVYLSGANYVGKTMLAKPVELKPGAASFVIASTDSTDRSQATADWICDETADEVEINAAIAYLSGLGSGELVIMEGTYNIAAAVTPLSNVNIRSCGAILKKSTGITYAINIDTQTDIIITNLFQDGNSQTGSGFFEDDSTNIKYIACKAYGNVSNGFFGCNHLWGCKASDNDAVGFLNCNYLSGCEAYDNGSNGFAGGNYMVNCESTYNDQDGFDSNYLNGCRAEHNGRDGFRSCFGLTTCVSRYNTAYGCNACKRMGFNVSDNNTTGQYSACYADSGTSNAAADTAAGGYNA